MTPEQQSAMAVVERAAKEGAAWLTYKHARAIIDMLADASIFTDVMRKLGKPVAVMPAESTPEAVDVMYKSWRDASRGLTVAMTMEVVYRALHAHLTKPPTRVEWDITGTDKYRRLATHTTVAAEAEISHAVQTAIRAGVDALTIVRREVVG